MKYLKIGSFLDIVSPFLFVLKQSIDFVIKEYDEDMLKMNLDKKLIYIVFQNILSNAIKYTPVGGMVKLQIIKKARKVEILVSDNGIGIPKNQQKYIFTKLFRADNVRKADTDGTGLGMYIVKMIVDHSGGKITFKSQENKGTTFRVVLPIKGMKKKKGTKTLG